MVTGKDILIAILIYVIGRIIIRQISALVARILEKRIDASVLPFLLSLLMILLLIILVVAVIGGLRVVATSFAALLASSGGVAGVVLPGRLFSFAGGLMILLINPPKVGDYFNERPVIGGMMESTDYPQHNVVHRQPPDYCAPRKPPRR
jgi:Small-conductance mechanosensitive channel